MHKKSKRGIFSRLSAIKEAVLPKAMIRNPTENQARQVNCQLPKTEQRKKVPIWKKDGSLFQEWHWVQKEQWGFF